MTADKAARQLDAALTLAKELGRCLQIDASLRLWDGSLVPLGPSPRGKLAITIGSAGVISSILRRPTLDRIVRHYAHGQLGIEGGTIIDLGKRLSNSGTRKRLRQIDKRLVLKSLWPFLFSRAEAPSRSREFIGNLSGKNRDRAENRDFVKFHYDVGNEFYQLFLDPWMQYTCAYFKRWGNRLEQARAEAGDDLPQAAPEARRALSRHWLRLGRAHLPRGEKVWRHRARHHAVGRAARYARDKVKRLGLEDRVTVELTDYSAMAGEFDKIASIGMYEDIGVKNIPDYMVKMRSLRDDGLFLNHAIARRAPKPGWFGARCARAACDRQVHLSWRRARRHRAFDRRHGARGLRDPGRGGLAPALCATCRLWCERLTAEREKAIGLRRARKVPHLGRLSGGVSLAFTRGTLRIYQTLVSRTSKGESLVPPTRADLYL